MSMVKETTTEVERIEDEEEVKMMRESIVSVKEEKIIMQEFTISPSA